MGKKYVATIMNRLYLGDEKFIYYVSHPAIGEYDEKTGIFKDKNGTEYLSIVEPCLFMSEITNGFSNIVEMDSLPKRMNEKSMHGAISTYNYYCSRHVYFVSKTEDNKIFCIPIDLDKMRDNLNITMQEIDKCGGLENYHKKQQEQQLQQIQSVADEEYDEENAAYMEDDDVEEKKEDFMHNREVKDDIATILLDMLDGLYSLDDLKDICEVAREHRDAVEGLLDSLELQIEASERGDSKVQLKIPKEKPEKEKINDLRKVLLDNRINLDDLLANIKKTLIAQDDPANRVITEIARKEQMPEFKERGLLITGESGSGKTKLMKLIAKYLDRPFIKIDSTQLTIPGYVGKDIETELWRLYYEICGGDLKKAERAIVFFDEIDKKGSSKKDDVSGRGVLNVLLPFIEGSVYEATSDVKTKKDFVEIDTSNMITILGGAFTDVYNDLKAEGKMGFGADVKSKDAKREATVEDFIKKAKMPDEFMGRLSIIKMNDLDLDALKRIMLESDESAVKMQKRLFDQLGVKLTLDDSYLNEIADQALKRKTGARGLNTVVDDTTWVAYRDAYSHDGEYDEIILTDETVKDPKVYKKVYKNNKKEV